MHVVGSNDRNDLDAIVAARLGHRHLIEAAVRAGNVRRLGTLKAALRIRTERSGSQFVAIIEPCGHAVHRANECSRPASDHSQAQPAIAVLLHGFYHASFLSTDRPSISRFLLLMAPVFAKVTKPISGRPERLDQIHSCANYAFYRRFKASSSSSVSGQSDPSSRDKLRSASTRPPVWH